MGMGLGAFWLRSGTRVRGMRRGFWMVPWGSWRLGGGGGGFYALATVWGPLGGGEGEGGKLKAAVKSHSLVAPRGGWRIH